VRKKEWLRIHEPAAEDVLRWWPVSKRIDSSRMPGDDPALI
jgi:hypothetical protein